MMFSITEHIEYLAAHHDCVVIPGWGAFVANDNAANYDVRRMLFEHPRRTMVFNAEVDHNDGLLAQSLMRREGMDYDTAMRFITDSVATFRRQLAHGGEVSMGRLGHFRSPKGRYVEYVPFSPLALNDKYFGLNDLNVKTVDMLERENHVEQTPVLEPTRRNLFSRKAAQIAASVAVLIGLGVVLTTPIVVDRNQQHMASMAPAVTAPRQQQLDVTVEQGVVPSAITPVSTQPTIASVGNESGRYYMVIGTVRNQHELNHLKKTNPKLVPYMKTFKYKRFMCVYVARSDDYNTLMGLRSELPKHLRDVWIYN